MINKILSTIAILGVLVLTGYEYFQAAEHKIILEKFVSKGPRFTAQDGQELCERIKNLETHSYGYKDYGYFPLDCNYYKK